ncbi:hypothetical protein BME96_18955 (plasmid) [Virgibacillus halodenitrificans]|uniref:Uncharacterized protein n=1 Tax=Virgibacillus halodenitrificans TaxID=1482 RepID=A0AAC9NMS9_VIRHA|nr:hypothetical protein [Virgibacillus halodenitrificans]APC50363.1 hypothetical protein BME96_18955 [Virgibacillus halodenitrificans]AVD54450.1 hypothetical protein CKF96_02765 [Priestia filamentosa]CDQ37678.1 hypothetical protein BN993_07240 [Virgibacillus halodenitrificans]
MRQNSVLKGMKERTPGNIVPDKVYTDKEENKEVPKSKVKTLKDTSDKKSFKNQQYQVKISDKIKEELNALKIVTKTKFDYEIIELLIDSYVRNELTTSTKRKFKAMTSDE